MLTISHADTSLFNRKPLYTIIHSLQLAYIPSHSCFTASAGRPSARRPPACRPALLLALGQHWPNIYLHVIQKTQYIIIGVGTTLAQQISLKPLVLDMCKCHTKSHWVTVTLTDSSVYRYTCRQNNLYRMFFANFSVNYQPISMKFCKDNHCLI